MAVMMTTNSKV